MKDFGGFFEVKDSDWLKSFASLNNTQFHWFIKMGGTHVTTLITIE